MKNVEKLRSWLRQLADETCVDWISYGSMSHLVHGRLIGFHVCSQGLALNVKDDAGNIKRVVWRCTKEFAEQICNCMDRYWRDLNASIERVEDDDTQQLAFAGYGNEDCLYADETDVAFHQSGQGSIRFCRRPLRRSVHFKRQVSSV